MFLLYGEQWCYEFIMFFLCVKWCFTDKIKLLNTRWNFFFTETDYNH